MNVSRGHELAAAKALKRPNTIPRKPWRLPLRFDPYSSEALAASARIKEVAGPATVQKQSEKGRNTVEMLVLLGVIVVWLALQLWILPKMGVST